MPRFRKARVFYNRRSGPGASRFRRVADAFSAAWAAAADDLAWYFPSSREESMRQLDAALADGADCIAVCGGDGTVSSIGARLIGTGVPLAVVPMGSGNGLARHFGIPQDPAAAVEALASAPVRDMDAGFASGRPFLVSASVAWDAELVRAYDKLPMRGVGSYVIAGAVSILDWKPQPVTATVDGAERLEFPDPLIFTVGNVSGWGGGALIDPAADASDGRMELVAGNRRDAPRMLASLADVFSKGACALPGATSRKFSSLVVERPEPGPVQLDGELFDAPAKVEFTVRRGALRILVPAPAA
ncbi:MAG: hypothetical protein IJ678_07240 [Kiritimatiellae bacterium]|nr:hypothetical protein [Kiritimatiellia bacterium]